MRYLGGKHRQGPKIAEHIAHAWCGQRDYFEPFCGAMGAAYRVVQAMQRTKDVLPTFHLSDGNEALVTMWRAVLQGWEPPDSISEDEYNALREEQDPANPVTAFAGFGSAFGAHWFSTYARGGDGRDFATQAKMSILRKAKVLKTVERLGIVHRSFETVQPEGAIVYLDPPYAGKSNGYPVEFDYDGFWAYARMLAETNLVCITEFQAPADFPAVYSWGDTVQRHVGDRKGDGTIAEQIFVPQAQFDLWRMDEHIHTTARPQTPHRVRHEQPSAAVSGGEQLQPGPRTPMGGGGWGIVR